VASAAPKAPLIFRFPEIGSLWDQWPLVPLYGTNHRKKGRTSVGGDGDALAGTVRLPSLHKIVFAVWRARTGFLEIRVGRDLSVLGGFRRIESVSFREQTNQVGRLSCFSVGMFDRTGLFLMKEWLRRVADKEALKRDDERVQKTVLEALLKADLRQVSRGSMMPDMLYLQDRAIIEGEFLVQVINASDVARSQRSIDKEEEILLEDEEEEVREKRRSGRGNGERLLKMELTDGRKVFMAIELKRIPQLEGFCGEKLLLNNCHVRRGCLIIIPECCVVIGGCRLGENHPEQNPSPPQAIPQENAQRKDKKVVVPAQIQAPSVGQMNREDPQFKRFSDVKVGERAMVKGFFASIRHFKVGAQGLDVEICDGKDVVIATTTNEFIESILGASIADVNNLKQVDKNQYKEKMKEAGAMINGLEGFLTVEKTHSRPPRFLLKSVESSKQSIEAFAKQLLQHISLQI